MRYTAAQRVSSYGKRFAFSGISRHAYQLALPKPSEERRYTLRRRKTLVAVLTRGGIAVIPTDTLYGIVACALNSKAVRRLYSLRRKAARKPFIILLPNRRALRLFGVVPTPNQKRFLNSAWPGSVSVILPCALRRLSYLHRGTNSLAFRVPKQPWLQSLLRKTGPLAAPSANPEGKRPARTISEARRYFGDAVALYVRGTVRTHSSTLVSMLGPAPVMIRRGGGGAPKKTSAVPDVRLK